MRVRGVSVLAASTLAIVTAVTGCGTGQEEEVDPGVIAPTDLPTIPALENAVGAREDAVFSECPLEPGADPTITGTITNSADVSRAYVAVVSWVTDSSDVLDQIVIVWEDVAPGETVEMAAAGARPDGATGCTFNVQAGDPIEDWPPSPD